ncbi:unnamed protein product [Caenorhabditis sp. 36 PRJEB53466]|nr:unnamed protein product [Caenorhabditis sp. 36 PRJEB53466]
MTFIEKLTLRANNVKVEALEPRKKRTSSEGTSSGSGSSSDEEVTPTVIPLHKLSPAAQYTNVQFMKLDYEDRMENGYPFWDELNKKAVFASTSNDWHLPHDLKRRCARCWQSIHLSPGGTLKPTVCVYHDRPKWNHEMGQKHLPCCGSRAGTSKGCMIQEFHVFHGTWKQTLDEFVCSPKARGTSDYRSKKIYAIDCEMVYTLNGMEAARVSVVDVKGRLVMDTFVLPSFRILDYNTKFSGITAKDMENAVSLEACRLQLFQLINEETILVGHSLESDLKALRLVHSNLIDTSLLFSAPNQSNFMRIKYSLKTLAETYLQKKVQTSATGHSSVEDATICMELVGTGYVSGGPLIP